MTTGKRIVLGIVFADFAALTAYAIWREGFAGSLALVFANVATTTLFVDASIALTLFALWMWEDARAEGRRWLPYALLTLGFGSVGPLLYLLLGRGSEAPRVAAARRVAA